MQVLHDGAVNIGMVQRRVVQGKEPWVDDSAVLGNTVLLEKEKVVRMSRNSDACRSSDSGDSKRGVSRCV